MMYELADHLGQPLSTILSMTENEYNHWWTFLRLRQERIDGEQRRSNSSNQGALSVGSSVTINFYPEGADSGDTYYSGTALVTGVTRSASFDGMVEASITLQGSGALTASTV